MPALLEVIGAERRFGPVVALDGVDLEVCGGEVVALLGENGAGKSTLVEALAGRLHLTRGTLKIDDRPYRPTDPRQARAAGVGVVHQHDQLVEAFTVAENLRLVFSGWSSADVVAAWQSVERRLGVTLPKHDAFIRDLGIGERQWIEIGKALLAEPRLMVLDEPTAVLTPAEADKLGGVIRGLARAGVAVIFITHRLDEVSGVADRVVVLRRGRIVASLAADAPSGDLATAMTGRIPERPERVDKPPGDVAVRVRGVALPPRMASIDFEVRSGEIVVLAGVDGNGQVEVAERVAGLRGGTGVVEVVESGAHSRADLRPDVGFVPADRRSQGLFPNLSVSENLVAGWLDRAPYEGFLLLPARVVAAGEKEVDRFSIVARPDSPASDLSGGNQQKVVVARALADGPPIVVAINPTRGLDVASQSAVQTRLIAAARSGSAVLVVTSDLDEARILGNRILVFSRGEIIGHGGPETPRDLLARWVGGEAA